MTQIVGEGHGKMKAFTALLLGLCLVAPSWATPVQLGNTRDDALDNLVLNVINNFFASLTTGIPALGIPPLDPLTLGSVTIPTITLTGGHVDVSLSDVAISDLSRLTLTSLHLNLTSLSMDLRSILPYLKIYGGYSLDGIYLTIFPIYGDGPFTVEVFDVVMLGGGSLGIDDAGHLQLTSLAMDANFTTMVVNLENLLGGGDLGDTINGIVSNIGSSIFYEVKPLFINALIDGIMKVVNDALSQINLPKYLFPVPAENKYEIPFNLNNP